MDDEDDAHLALTETALKHPPPELTTDSESDSDEDPMPPSPPNPTIGALMGKQRQAIATTSF